MWLFLFADTGNNDWITLWPCLVLLQDYEGCFISLKNNTFFDTHDKKKSSFFEFWFFCFFFFLQLSLILRRFAIKYSILFIFFDIRSTKLVDQEKERYL